MDSNQIKLSFNQQNNVTVHLFGASVISWRVNGKERLFLSEKTNLKNFSQAFRGGIPIVFPHFNMWDDGKPKHGFARISFWKYEGIVKGNDFIKGTFTLKDTEETNKYFDFRFQLKYNVFVGNNSLKCEMIIENNGDNEMPYHFLFHNYFKLDDMKTMKIIGLQHQSYTEKYGSMENTKKDIDENEFFSLPTEKFKGSDRIYDDHRKAVQYHNAGSVLTVNRTNLNTIVIWNPWTKLEEYENFICIEPGDVTRKNLLGKRQSVTHIQSLEIK
ncbi:hypothetical protein SNEBB_004459 [Seison nebaliae]|nr:hypothetical protein SNEBB_004459 [Seison nebaliae]